MKRLIFFIFVILIFTQIYTYEKKEKQKYNKEVIEKIEKDFNHQIKIRLKVAYLEDPRFPKIEIKELKAALKYAELAMIEEFNAENIKLYFVKKLDIKDYFKSVLKNIIITPPTYNPFKPKYKPITALQKDFYKQYKLKDLKKFVPNEDRIKIKTNEDYNRYIFEAWVKKSKKFFIPKDRWSKSLY